MLKQIYDVPKNHQLIINLPETFNENKKVLVTIDNISDNQQKKIELLKEAVKDPLFMEDLEEVNRDFDRLETETL